VKAVTKTIGQALEEMASQYQGNEALVHQESGLRYTYGLMAWEIDRIARGLLALGIRKGDRVALWAPNVPGWVVAQLALAMVGAIMVPINPASEQGEIHHILSQTDSKAIIMSRGQDDEEFINMISDEKDKLGCIEYVIVLGETSYPDTILWAELAARGDEVGAEELAKAKEEVQPEDPVAIMYTSGTTGKPKGVVLDHLGLVNKSLCAAQRLELGPHDRSCLFFPLYHMFGNTCIALTTLLVGGSIVIPGIDFDPSSILSTIANERCTAVFGSPSMFSALVEDPAFRMKGLETVNKGIVGGAPCPHKLMERLVNDIGITGLVVGYGITEASSWITMTHPNDPIEMRVTTIGRPLPCNDVKVTDPETGEDVGQGAIGELCTKGFLMKGYYKMPAATAACVDREGWFHTGDLATVDEKGYVRMVGRLKEVINKDGVEIYPAEVEEVIYGLPQVAEAQVFGFTGKDGKTRIGACIRLKKGTHMGTGEIRDRIRAGLEPEKLPEFIKIVDEFPVTKSGKVQKFKLAEMATRESS